MSGNEARDDLVGVLHPLITQLTTYFHEIIIDFVLDWSVSCISTKSIWTSDTAMKNYSCSNFRHRVIQNPSTRRLRLQSVAVNNWLKKKDSV